MDTTQLTSPSPIEVGKDAEDEGGGDGDRVPALAQHGLVSADDLRERQEPASGGRRGETTELEELRNRESFPALGKGEDELLNLTLYTYPIAPV